MFNRSCPLRFVFTAIDWIDLSSLWFNWHRCFWERICIISLPELLKNLRRLKFFSPEDENFGGYIDWSSSFFTAARRPFVREQIFTFALCGPLCQVVSESSLGRINEKMDNMWLWSRFLRLASAICCGMSMRWWFVELPAALETDPSSPTPFALYPFIEHGSTRVYFGLMMLSMLGFHFITNFMSYELFYNEIWQTKKNIQIVESLVYGIMVITKNFATINIINKSIKTKKYQIYTI